MMSLLPIYPRHVTALDLQFHFEDKESSSVKSIEHDFDYETMEHVVVIEYRVKVTEEPEPQIDLERKARMQKATEEIEEMWRDCLRPMLDRFPFLDKYM